MGMEDLFEDLCLDAEAEGNRDLWLRAAATALTIALRKVSKRRAAYWTREAVRCIASADPEAEEEFERLLRYSTWRALDETVQAFEEKYFCIDEVLD